jgi:hypothetical protein
MEEGGMRAYARVVLSLVVVGGVLLAAAPAGAKPIVKEHYSGTFSEIPVPPDGCPGMTLLFEGEFSGVFMLKAGKKGDPTPYYFDNYRYRQVVTNLDNGKFFVQEGNGLYKDMKIVNVSGTIYRFEAMESGQPFKIYDSAGNLVMRDRGRLHTTFLVDTKGDSDLSNDVFVAGSFALLKESGSHPGFDADYCELAESLLL